MVLVDLRAVALVGMTFWFCCRWEVVRLGFVDIV